MPGHSPGADREVERAKGLGIPVFHDIDALITWCCPGLATMTIYEIWWFSQAKPEYRCAGPSPYGQHHGLKTCAEWHGEHVCYLEAASLQDAMKAATERHPDWQPLPEPECS